MSIQCTICLSTLNVKDDTIHTTNCGHCFHKSCLLDALKASRQCPQCRKLNVQHFQLYLQVADEEEEAAGAAGMSKDFEFLSKQMNQISKKLDNLSDNMKQGGSTGRAERGFNPVSSSNWSWNTPQPRHDNVNTVMQLQRENQDLREILEMEKILSTNTEQEIDQLKLEVRERNDLINALQGENDTLREELMLYGSRRRRVPTDNLVDL